MTFDEYDDKLSQYEDWLDENEIFVPWDVTEFLAYFDELRDSSITNMFGAAPYLQENYGVSKQVARKALALWMETFSFREEQDMLSA